MKAAVVDNLSIERKLAHTDHPVHEFIKRRWSPYGFDKRPVPEQDLLSLLEAARWAASSYNEQPWSYIVATQRDEEEFKKLLSCLLEGNREWAARAPVLMIGVAKLCHDRNGKENRVARHDLGLAAGNLTFEATSRGLYVHQMVGILPDRAREIYSIPEGHEAVTGLAIGYVADPEDLPDKLRERDATERERKPLSEFVFRGTWKQRAPIIS